METNAKARAILTGLIRLLIPALRMITPSADMTDKECQHCNHLTLHMPLRSDDPGLLDRLIGLMSGQKVETLFALFADCDGNFIKAEELGIGTAVTVSVSPRHLFGRALAMDSRALLLVHNHPSGDARASACDVSVTRALIHLAAILEITVMDHLIVGGNQIYSMRKSGDL